MSNFTGKDLEKMIKTTDNWYPNYPNDEVNVDLYICDWLGDDSFVCVYIEGADDYCLERVGKLSEYNELRDLYDSLPEPITQEWLLRHGFGPE